MLALLLSAGCSSLPASIAPAENLVPRPAAIDAETQAQIPGLLDRLEAGEPLTETDRRLAKFLVKTLFVEREKLRAARATLAR